MTQLNDIELPDNLYWSDEFTWSPVDQATERTLTGSQVVEETPRIGGRPLTLEGAWVSRATVEALKALEAQAATEMTLTLADGRTFTVLWRRGSNAGVEAQPVFEAAPGVTPAFYRLTLRLMEA